MTRSSSSKSAEPPRLALTNPRERTDQLLMELISKGQSLLATITSTSDFELAQKAYFAWDSRNHVMLKALFTTEEMLETYKGFYIPISYTAPLDRRNAELYEQIESHVQQLISIRDATPLLQAPDEGQETASTTSAVLTEVTASTRSAVFIVHGRDEAAKEAVARLVERQALEAVILAEQPNGGRTLIEKFEAYASSVVFALVLLTPDDVGGPITSTVPDEQQERARENVIFELGYFVGQLGRGKVCVVKKGGANIPSDLQGIAYIAMDSSNAWRVAVLREMEHAGIRIDMGRL